MKTAIITGVLGQDGSYLAEYLLSLNYHVVGISRRKSTDAENWGFLNHLKNHPHFELIYGDITDGNFITDLLIKYYPDEFYNLAAQSHVGYSFENPIYTMQVTGEAPLLILSLIHKHSSSTKFYQASTSELFGGINCPVDGYTEESPFHPRSPYAVAKLAAHWGTINYRESRNLFACCGILFNHGSPRRGLDFIERKLTKSIAALQSNNINKIKLGNLEAYRDLGHSKDYVKAMHLMLQQDVPKEYIISTGKTYNIKYILEKVAELANIKNIYKYIEFDPKLMRPSEVPYLLGDCSLAKKELNWTHSYDIDKLLAEMYHSEWHGDCILQ